MIEFLFYSLKLAVSLIVLYLPYQFLFKKTTFFQWNRIYLLGAILFSLVLPFQIFQIELTVPSENINQVVHTLENISQLPENNSEIERQLPQTEKLKSFEADETNFKPFKSENSDQDLSIKNFFTSHWITICYLSGFILFLLSLISRLIGVFLLIRRNETIHHHDFHEVSLKENQQQVFSFFNYIFFNSKLFPAATQETLIKHELVHIRQWHSVDVLILEILQAIFWFNPLFHFFKKSLQNEHEYLADQQSVKNLSKSSYTHTLLALATKKQPLLGQAFAYIPIGNRILKLSQKPSISMEKSKYLATLPIITFLFICFSCSLNELDKNIEVANGKNLQVKSVNVTITTDPSQASQHYDIGNISFDESGKFDLGETTLINFSTFFINRPKGKQVPSVMKLLSMESKWSFLNHNKTLENTTGLERDFYPKSIHWLVGYEWYEWMIDQEVFLFLKQPEVYASVKRKELIDEKGFAYRLNFIHTNENYFKAERMEDGGKSTVETRIILNEQQQPITWTNTKFFKSNSTINTFENPSHTNRKTNHFEIEYNAYQLLSSITKTHIEEWEANLPHVEPVTSSKILLKLFYNAKNQIETLEYFDHKGNFAQKYVLSYDENGYCTKKSYFDAKGKLKLALMFDYEYVQGLE